MDRTSILELMRAAVPSGKSVKVHVWNAVQEIVPEDIAVWSITPEIQEGMAGLVDVALITDTNWFLGVTIDKDQFHSTWAPLSQLAGFTLREGSVHAILDVYFTDDHIAWNHMVRNDSPQRANLFGLVKRMRSQR